MKRRFFSILLVCCMVLTMQPTAVFAAVSDSLGNTPGKIRRFWSSSPP